MFPTTGTDQDPKVIFQDCGMQRVPFMVGPSRPIAATLEELVILIVPSIEMVSNFNL